MKLAIIDYNAVNVQSVLFALERLGIQGILTNDKEIIQTADKVIFPGVGHARHAMNTLRAKELDQVIREVTQPLLGICLGMQLLFEYSEEGETECLGLIKGRVKKFNNEAITVPQMGWNTIQFDAHPLFESLGQDPWFYSVHSYYAEINDATISSTEYGHRYSSTVKKDNFIGTQYHPEKSSENGAILLRNFLKI